MAPLRSLSLLAVIVLADCMGVMALSGALLYGEPRRVAEPGGRIRLPARAYGPGRSHFSTVGNVCIVHGSGHHGAPRGGSRELLGYALGFPAMAHKGMRLDPSLIIAAVNIAGLAARSGLMQGLNRLSNSARLALIAVLAFALHTGSWSNLVPFVAQTRRLGFPSRRACRGTGGRLLCVRRLDEENPQIGRGGAGSAARCRCARVALGESVSRSSRRSTS